MKSRLENDQPTFFALAFESPRLESDFVLHKGERLDCAFHVRKSRRVRLVGQGRVLCKKGPLPVSAFLRFDSTLAKGANACGRTSLRAGSALSMEARLSSNPPSDCGQMNRICDALYCQSAESWAAQDPAPTMAIAD